MKKALMYASVASMIKQFNMNNIRILLELGYAVDVACNMEQGSTISDEKVAAMRCELESMGVRVFHVPVPRKITAVSDIFNALKMSRELMNNNGYELIHCHSPIGGMICRVANRFSKGYGKTKMIYTAHGFHFFKGAPKKNWLMYYPIEKLCSGFTDVLVTINKEDYALAQKKMRAAKTEYVPGVGIDTAKLGAVSVDSVAKKREIGVPEDAVVMVSVGELNENKNHEVVVRAMPELSDNVHYVIAGQGNCREHLLVLAQSLGVSDRLHLLGYRDDVPQLCAMSDLFVFPSFREGLSVSVMEAMALGRAVVCSKIRGNTDLIEDGGGGFHADPSDPESFKNAVEKLLADKQMRIQMGNTNKEHIRNFGVEAVDSKMRQIYAAFSAE